VPSPWRGESRRGRTGVVGGGSAGQWYGWRPWSWLVVNSCSGRVVLRRGHGRGVAEVVALNQAETYFYVVVLCI
jgi:hypothetical protein